VSALVERFTALHRASQPLLLPNAWDAASAALLQDLGADAVATSSASLAWSLGYPDGGALPPAELLAAVGRITRVMRVPLTIDIEEGYSSDPEEVATLVQVLVEQGIAGINLEDGTGPVTLLKGKIEAIRQRVASDQLFINARTDVFLQRLAPPKFEVEMTRRRAAIYHTAGANGLFVPGLTSRAHLEEIANGTELFVNLMAIPGLPPTAELFAAGMRRLSLGAAPFKAAYAVARDITRPFLSAGSLEAMFPPGGIDYAAMNALLTSPAQE
jgi:2-methylisocitrate lyase-like PEP mutase family enzyme